MIPVLVRFSRPLVFATLAPLAASASGDADLALRHLREFHGATRPGFAMHDTNEAAPSRESALRDREKLGAAGAWPDIEYTANARSSWPPGVHAMRMAGMAAQFAEESGEEKQKYADALHRAFAYWISHDPKCVNWWYNQIGVPKHLALTAILMGDALRPEERRYLLRTVAPRCAIAMTGQNRLWLAGNTLMFALLAGDEALVQKAADTIAGEVAVSTREGIRPDFSFHQHGPQQQFGNYGLAFATEVTRWAGVLRDTRWKLPDAKLAVFREYMLQGQNWVSWRGAMDIGACGRQFMPGTPRKKTRSIVAAMSECAQLDPAHASGYRAFVERNQPGAKNDLVGTKFFWRSDYLVHRTPELCFTLKMSSNRVIGAETTNGENMSGYHIADGMLLTYREGDEYEEIFPVWDWKKIPGTTAPQSPLPKFNTAQVKTDFVGGVTDGDVGVAALDYAKDGVKAHKAWFFTPTGVVALGAGITSDGDAPVVTTVEQSLAKDVTTGGGSAGSLVRLPGTKEYETTKLPASDQSAVRGGVSYKIFGATGLGFGVANATGNWTKIFNNPATPREDVSAEIFSGVIHHGMKPRNAVYAYAICPKGSEVDLRKFWNAAEIQSAGLDANRTGYVFWQPGEFKSRDTTLAVDAPCLVIHDRAKRAFIVAEPTRKLKALTLTYAGKAYVVKLPESGYAGASVRVSAE